MNRNQILVGALILILSWTTVAAVTFAITREISEYEPPFGNYYEFDTCLNEQRNLDWCNAYYTATDDMWNWLREVYLPRDSRSAVPEPRLVLLVADELFHEQVIYETNPLPNGECRELETVDIRFLLNSYVGVRPRISMNDDCEIYLDIPEIK
ncbi:MAG: hypothetical protein OXC83_05360 [Chloroflexi bacterium]|nr:hypothetical protein [Chloroflexota bacterium]